MSKVWIYGFNPFDLNSDGELKEVPLDTHFPNHDLEHFLMELTSTHALVASGNILYSKSCITEQANELDCGSRIVQLAANNWHCLVLLDSGTLLKYDIHSNQSIRLGFLAVENVSNSDEKTEKVTHIACGDTVSLAVTSEKSVYNIPNKTFTFPRHARIRKIAVGLEHCLLLTGNGDVYSWGCGLRGQLGNGEITPNQEQPQLVEALAGVKIIDVAAGGWHSAAVSSFGDLYCWGWNSKGQLGLVDEKQTRGSVFTLPQVIELDERNEDVVLERVYCGSGHTIVVPPGFYRGNCINQNVWILAPKYSACSDCIASVSRWPSFDVPDGVTAKGRNRNHAICQPVIVRRKGKPLSPFGRKTTLRK